MNKIYKYELQIKDSQSFQINSDYKILSVAEQNGKLCMWVLVNLNNPITWMNIEIIGTGNQIDEQLMQHNKFIGSVVMHNGFVWHVFDNLAPF